MSAHKKAMLSFIDESKRGAMTLAKTPKARAQCETIFAALTVINDTSRDVR